MSEAKGPVLVADDVETLRGMTAAFLGEMGHAAHCVENIESAKRWLVDNTPALFVLDIMLPDGNGLDLCRWIRAQPRLEAVPILFMTAIKDEETLQDALELGAMDYIKKPFEFAAFSGKVERLLRKR